MSEQRINLMQDAAPIPVKEILGEPQGNTQDRMMGAGAFMLIKGQRFLNYVQVHLEVNDLRLRC